MIPVPLQTAMCDASKDFGDYMTEFQFIKAPVCTFADPAGFLVVGLLVWGAISLSIYIRTDSVMIPTVLLLLTGGAVMSQLAAPATAVAGILILCSGAGIFTYLYYRYSR